MQIYNTLTKNKQYFKTLKDKQATIYACGITPYDTTHLGHAFTYVSFDALIRYLKYQGYRVTYTQNVTDINDRDNDILRRAKQQRVSWKDLSNFWTAKFLDDMEYLNWLMPDNYLYASQQLHPMIDLIQKLLDNKVAYLVNGSVYLDINKDKTYGQLSRLNGDEMSKIAKSFDEDLGNKDKKHPLDITLWRRSALDQPKHIPSFESPYGKGRPGWHIECSAMAISSLGERIDIHGGGKDLIFPHHEAEIAQSEKATGKVPFARYWMHTGQVSYRNEKMSKSLGNLVMISDLRKKYSTNAIRFMLLSNHYRSDWEYTKKTMEQAKTKMAEIEEKLSSNTNFNRNLTQELDKALEDDLNIPLALKLIHENIELANKQKTKEYLRMLGFIF